jgi:hypothetical protein
MIARLGMPKVNYERIRAPHWPAFDELIKCGWTDLNPDYANDLRLRVLYDPGYHWSLQPLLRHAFPGIENIQINYSTQADADIFVLTFLNGKINGTYLELGAGNPINSNNTFLLTKFGWHGISVDINHTLVPLWANTRSKSIFMCMDALTLDYIKLFEQNNFSSQIDFLQIDIDSPPDQIQLLLDSIPFDSYRFSVIMAEHNFGLADDHTKYIIENKLLSYGYKKIANNIVFKNYRQDQWIPFEDWWIDPLVIDKEIQEKFSSGMQDKTWSFELLCKSNSLNEINQAKTLKNIWNNKLEEK